MSAERKLKLVQPEVSPDGLTLQEQTRARWSAAVASAEVVPCPRCPAGLGEPCFTRKGAVRAPHAARAHILMREPG